MKREVSLWSALVIVALWVMALAVLSPGAAQAQQPVVYAALFYSPTCGHCHYVITEFLPPLQAEYGEQLQILFIDVSSAGGGALFQNACYTLAPNNEHCGYVPTLVIGETVLVGSGDIPAQMPDLVKDGLAAGGIGLPAIPGLREAYEAAVGTQADDSSDAETASDETGGESADETATDDIESAEASAEPAADVDSEIADISTAYVPATWQDRLRQDPTGNGLAIVVLGVLVAGIGTQVARGMRLLQDAPAMRWEMGRVGWLVALGLALLTMVIAGTLALENTSVTLPALLAAGVTLGLAGVAWAIARASRQPGRGYVFADWLMPALALLGLVVAGYLAFVEVSENEAVCGAVGDCNTVQQSDYAKIFGVLPIGVLGVAGYVIILGAWLLGRFGGGRMADRARAALLALALFGTAISIYLTFLEPFVIGATCAWCLTSAMLMILILCLHAPAGWAALNRLRGGRFAAAG